MIGSFCIIRCRDAGIHCGYVKNVNQRVVLLEKECRRIHRWKGPNTLNELALYGADMDYTRISEPVESILLLEACEVILCTEKAKQNLMISRWSEE